MEKTTIYLEVEVVTDDLEHAAELLADFLPEELRSFERGCLKVQAVRPAALAEEVRNLRYDLDKAQRMIDSRAGRIAELEPEVEALRAKNLALTAGFTAAVWEATEEIGVERNALLDERDHLRGENERLRAGHRKRTAQQNEVIAGLNFRMNRAERLVRRLREDPPATRHHPTPENGQ